MLAFARRPEPQRRPIGAPGITEAEFDRMRSRLQGSRDMTEGRSIPALKFERSSTTITEGTRL